MSQIKNPKLKELSLQAGGSHYPTVNPDMQTLFAKLIINECIAAVERASINKMIGTTYDKDIAESVKAQCIRSINETFGV